MKLISAKIISLRIIPYRNRLKIQFTDGSILYLIYNRAGEYGYQLMFSSNELDRIRFDSMDKYWNVNSRPNHFHPRNITDGYDNPMNGDPNHDLPILCELILSNKLKNQDLRF